MADIKTKDLKPKTVKSIDKTIAWTERVKDPLVYLNEKTKEAVDGNQDVNDYGSDKIKYLSNRTKDETIYNTKKGMNYGKNKAIEVIKKKKNKMASNSIKTAEKANKKIKEVGKGIKNTKKAAKTNKMMLERGRRLAIKSAKVAVKGTKLAIKGTIKGIKAMIAAVKSLIGLLVAGGSVAVIVIIVICLIGLLFSSIFGIFFSSLKIDIGVQPKTMNECIVDLNNEMNKKISDIENSVIHDEVVINSNRANWKDIIATYSIKVNGGNDQDEVMTLDLKKQSILRTVFWDMNTITYEIRNETYKSQSIGTWDKRDFNLNEIQQGKPITFEEEEKEEMKLILYITITSKSLEDMKQQYAFNSNQLQQLEEITGEDKESMWNAVIYGTYGDKGEIAEWKQKGKEWSNIKIGNTSSTIGDIGCLVTSISILIKKSEVETPNIEPFNPGTFVMALNYNYGFDAGGNLQYGAIAKAVPSFEYQGKVNLRDKTKTEKLSIIKDYYQQGYYMAAEVLGAKINSQHWVAIDNVKDNTILMLDPGSNAVDMWQQYDWNNTTQFIYFKIKE